MFNSLVESSSHSVELKRRGSFLIFTAAAYAILIVVAGVISIQVVDAKLDEQSLEIVTMMPLIEMPAPEPAPGHPAPNPAPGSNPTNDSNVATRQKAMADVSTPQLMPDKVSAVPNKVLPIPTRGSYIVNGLDSNPGRPGNGPNNGGERGGRVNASSLAIVEPPPPMPPKKEIPKIIRKPVLNGEALHLPKPPYPPIARHAGVQGTVSIQVLIDVTGKVVSAQVVSGNPLLAAEAKRAAYQAVFSPTKIGDQPVKVSGVIIYNFVINK